jgi:site-specific DNA recombinase
MATHKAIALCRVSTSKQRVEGSSLEAQEARVYEAADYLEAEIVKLWSLDTSSKKGVNLQRKDLLEMIAFCKANKTVRYLIIDEIDRFMRSIEEYYWWKVEFKQIGVEIRFASKPELSGDDQRAVFDEMIDIYRAESSNIERKIKTTDKMQAKIKAGYYPGMVHQGYQKSDVPSLHIPREPQWSLLKEAMRGILYKGVSLSEALDWLNENGYRLQGGGLLDMHKLKRILAHPYYAGIVTMSNWEVVRKNGLHTAMITEDEHERLLAMVSGKRKKFTVKKFNPLFPASNIAECADCLDEQRDEARLVGYSHHNGKPERTRKFYERYRCRSCGRNILKQTVHNGLNKVLDDTELIIDDKGQFLSSMRKAWQADVADGIEAIKRLKQKQTTLAQEKDNLVRAMASNPGMAEDFKGSITSIKAEIETVESEIVAAANIEKDFDEFMEFSLDYVQHFKDNWWAAENPDDRIGLKELLYLDGLAIHRDGKVRTPKLSPIYRYKSKQKGSQKTLVTSNGGPGGTRTLDTLLKRQVL